MKYNKLKPDSYMIKSEDLVDILLMGNTTEIKYMSTKNHEPTVQKLSDKEYLVCGTGEIKKYTEKATSRSQSQESLRRTFKKITQYICTNVTDVNKVKFVTLTYKENMTDPKKLYEDFRKFNQCFYRYCIQPGLSKPEYIAVAEPQQRKAWHLHIIYIWKHTAPYIPYQIFRYLWGHGDIDVRKLHNAENIAGYMNAYLANMEIPEETARMLDSELIYSTNIDQKNKHFLKGARLPLYPSGFNIFRRSSGIKKPVKVVAQYNTALDFVQEKGQTLKYSSCGELVGEDNFKITIKKEEYRK